MCQVTRARSERSRARIPGDRFPTGAQRLLRIRSRAPLAVAALALLFSVVFVPHARGADSELPLRQLQQAAQRAAQHEARQEFVQAADAWQQMFEIAAEVYGNDYWRLRDLQHRRDRCRLLDRLAPEQRTELQQAERQLAAAAEMCRKGAFRDAYPAAEAALDKFRRLPGEPRPELGPCLAAMAAAQRGLGELDDAQTLCVEALACYGKTHGQQHPAYANALNSLGLLYHNMAKYAKAEPLYRQALEIRAATLGRDSEEYANTLHNLGGLYESTGRYDRAEPLLREAVEIARSHGGEQTPALAAGLAALGHVQLLLARFDDAEHNQRQSLRIIERTMGRESAYYALSLNNLGGFYRERGRYEEAEQLFDQARTALARSVGEQSPDYARCLGNLAAVYQITGRYSQALALDEQVLQVVRSKLGADHPSYATCLNNLAELYEQLGDYRRAADYFDQALQVARDSLGERHPVTAGFQTNFARYLFYLGREAEAESLLQQALEVQRDSLGEQHPSYALALNDLGLIYDALGVNDKAKTYYERALQVRSAADLAETMEYATTLQNLGYLQLRKGDLEDAADTIHRSAELQLRLSAHSKLDTAHTAQLLGVLALEVGDTEDAAKLFAASLTIAREIGGPTHPEAAAALNALAEVHLRRAEYARAEERAAEALEIRRKVLGERHPDYVNSLIMGARLKWTQGTHADARSLLRQAVAIDRANLDLGLSALAAAHQLQAAAALRRSLDACLSVPGETAADTQDVYQQVLAWKGAVVRRQQQARWHAAGPETAATFQELQLTCSRLAALLFSRPAVAQQQDWRQQIEQLLEQKEGLERQLVRAGGAGEAGDPAGLEAVQACLSEDGALVDFLTYQHSAPPADGPGVFTSERRLTAFVVRPGQAVRRYDLGPVEPIREAIEHWRSSLRNPREQQTVGQTLRRQLWDPLTAGLDGVRRVLVSPDGIVAKLPLAALPGREDGHYLLEEVALATVAVPQNLPRPRRRSEPARDVGDRDTSLDLLLVGDVDFDASLAAGSPSPTTRPEFHFARLPGTRAEAEAVGELARQRFPAGSVRVLTGAEAREETVRQEIARTRYAHFATHGFFAPQLAPPVLPADAANARGLALLESFDAGGSAREPQQGLIPAEFLSGIALSGANQAGLLAASAGPGAPVDDGILTAAELAPLPLERLELVVLSACESGLGREESGEGLLGLQRDLQVAGAAAVLSSLWKVDDAATAALMTEFYRNLWERKLDRMEALRAAQLAMLRRVEPSAATADPYYWAAFVLSGDWR